MTFNVSIQLILSVFLVEFALLFQSHSCLSVYQCICVFSNKIAQNICFQMDCDVDYIHYGDNDSKRTKLTANNLLMKLIFYGNLTYTNGN